MFGKQWAMGSDASAIREALDRSQAVIEFRPDGTILTANQNFLQAVGYSLDEIKGRHHSLFVDPAEQNSTSYRTFWADLARGEFKRAEFRRLGKGGREIWIQASYNRCAIDPARLTRSSSSPPTSPQISSRRPTSTARSRPFTVPRLSSSSTSRARSGGQQDFLDTLGYRLEDVVGRHHQMFVAQDERNTASDQEFWAALGRGEFQSAKYRRIGNGGKEVWIQATYNPIFDTAGKPFKVVKIRDRHHCRRRGAEPSSAGAAPDRSGSNCDR